MVRGSQGSPPDGVPKFLWSCVPAVLNLLYKLVLEARDLCVLIFDTVVPFLVFFGLF